MRIITAGLYYVIGFTLCCIASSFIMGRQATWMIRGLRPCRLGINSPAGTLGQPVHSSITLWRMICEITNSVYVQIARAFDACSERRKALRENRVVDIATSSPVRLTKRVL